MRILTTDRIKQWEKFSIEMRARNKQDYDNYPQKYDEQFMPNIHEMDLIESAAHAFCEELNKSIFPQETVVFCGMGNNGADGLVIARILRSQGWQIRCVYLLKDSSSEYSLCNQFNQNKISGIKVIHGISDVPQVSSDVLVIDALYGIGLSRPLSGIGAKVVENINKSSAIVVSVDMPSGLASDFPISGEVTRSVRADLVITFNVAKLSFFLPEYGKKIGQWRVVDTGLSKDFLDQEDSIYFTFGQDEAHRLIRTLDPWIYKNQRGHALIVGGSKGMVGCAILATKACLRTGAGLVSTYLPEDSHVALHSMIPEAMCVVDENESFFGNTMFDTKPFSIMCAGMGTGVSKKMQKILIALLQTGKPIVLDADAINTIAEYKMQNLLHSNCILTPHAKEFERLFGAFSSDYDRLALQQSQAIKMQCVIIFKGRYTTISLPDGRIMFNTSGNVGLAKAGSGDVLSGVVAGLLSQGYPTSEAALLGVYLHGFAADLALSRQSAHSLLASDVIESLGNAYYSIIERGK